MVAFPGAEFEALIYMLLGAFMALTVASGFYIWKLRRLLYVDRSSPEEEEEKPEIDKMGLTKKSEDVLGAVLEEPMLQSELPDRLNVSKATVSNAVSELFERQLIIKKKKANTYRIEPNRDEIKKQQR